MNLTLQLCNIDFDSSNGGRICSELSGGCLAEKSTSTLPTALRFILALWIPVWVFFLVWPLRKEPSRLVNAFSLIRANSEARRANAYGEEFHTFLRFCKDILPAGSTFRLVGVDYATIDKVRAFYFLYPSLVTEHAQFILVYEAPGYRESNTHPYASLNPGSFILRSAQPAIP